MSAVHPITVERVDKTYGRARALRDVQATLEPGRITAILGPNGAGKSTLLAILATLVSPTSGTLAWGSRVLDRRSDLRSRIGYVGHEPGLYGDLTALENLTLFAALYGLEDGEHRAQQMLERVGLADVRSDAPARTFSRGMQQRLALARALLHRPQLLLFDEPGSALDPAGARWLGAEMRTERDAGCIVVIVTHDLEAAGDLADHILVLRRGRVAIDRTGATPLGADAARAAYQEAVSA